MSEHDDDIELDFRSMIFEARAYKGYRNVTDMAIAKANEMAPGIGWFRVKRLAGTVEGGKRTWSQVRIEVGAGDMESRDQVGSRTESEH